MMRHEEHRWRVEALDETSRLFVDAQRERPPDALHSSRAKPLSSCLYQSLRHLGVVDGVEESEEPHVVLVTVEMKPVDLCRAAPDAPAIPIRGEYRALTMLKEGILLAQLVL